MVKLKKNKGGVKNMKKSLILILSLFLVLSGGIVSAEKMWNFNNHSLNVSDNIFSGGQINVTSGGDICIVGGTCLSDALTSGDGYIGLSQAHTAGGSLNMNNNLITNIGNAGTDFTTGGGLNVAGTFDPNGAITLPTTGISGAGSGSGLDADLWDGNQFASYLNQAVLTSSSPQFAGVNIGHASDTTLTRTGAGAIAVEGNTIWTSANDGSGSTLDADLLDGLHATHFYNASNPAGYITNAALANYVTGPASATDNAIARFDLATGKIIQNSGVTVDDSNSMVVGGDLTISGGDLTINNNNGGVNFNDANAYWLKTATNWGLYWDTTNNQLDFMGSGVERGYIDLDNGNAQFDGSVTASSFSGSGSSLTGVNADTLDGLDSSHFYNASNPAGYITAGEVDGAVSDVWVNESGDNMTGNLAMGGNDITGVNEIVSNSDSVMPNIVLDSSSGGDQWTSQGAYISLGESGDLGAAALHMTYRGDGYGFIGSGAVSNAEPGASYLRFSYNTNNIYTPDTLTAGAFVGNGSGLTSVDADTLDGIEGADYTREDLTMLGKTGTVSLDSVTNTAAEWSNLPVGYSRMIHSSIGTTQGAPVNNYGYFTKVANRDSSGGWGGLWAGYAAGENYIGRTGASTSFASWDLLWSDANDGSGSGLDADTLDGVANTDNYVMVGSGTAWEGKAMPDCTTGKLLYTASTNTFSCGTDANSGGDITGVTAGIGLTGGGTSGSVTLGIDIMTDDLLTDRASYGTGYGSGFYQTSTATTAEGWPEDGSWYFLINAQHSNSANNYAMQLAADFYEQDLFYRSTANSGSTAWNEVWHAGSDGSGSGLDADTLDGVANTDDYVMVGSGTAWEGKAMPDCTTGKLLYTASTNTFSCGTDANTQLSEATVESYIFDADAETVPGNWDFTSTSSEFPSHYYHNLYSGNVVYSHAYPSGYSHASGSTQYNWRVSDGVSGFKTLAWDGADSTLKVDGNNVLTTASTIPGDGYIGDVQTHTAGGTLELATSSYSSGIDTSTSGGIILHDGDQILSDDGSYLRNLLSKSGGTISIGQASTALITKINLIPGNSGEVGLYSDNAEVFYTSNGNVVATGDLTVAGEDIRSDTDINIHIDDNNEATTNYFRIYEGSDNLKFLIEEGTGGTARIYGQQRQLGIYNLGGYEWELEVQPGNNFQLIDRGAGIVPLVIENGTGNIGIGTSSPAGKLQIFDNTNDQAAFVFTESSTSLYTTTFNIDNTGLDIGHNSASRSLNLKTASLDRITIDGDGDVHIGTATSSDDLEIEDGGLCVGAGGCTAPADGYAYVQQTLGVGISPSSSYGLYVTGGSTNALRVTGSIFGSSTATISTSVTSGAYYYSSDERLKENVVVINDSLERIRQLEGINFNWKETGEPAMGLIAQDVEKVFPEIVSVDNETGMKTVAYGNLVAPLIESTKTLADQNDLQDEKINEQQKEIDELRADLELLKEEIINLKNSS